MLKKTEFHIDNLYNQIKEIWGFLEMLDDKIDRIEMNILKRGHKAKGGYQKDTRRIRIIP